MIELERLRSLDRSSERLSGKAQRSTRRHSSLFKCVGEGLVW